MVSKCRNGTQKTILEAPGGGTNSKPHRQSSSKRPGLWPKIHILAQINRGQSFSNAAVRAHTRTGTLTHTHKHAHKHTHTHNAHTHTHTQQQQTYTHNTRTHTGETRSSAELIDDYIGKMPVTQEDFDRTIKDLELEFPLPFTTVLQEGDDPKGRGRYPPGELNTRTHTLHPHTFTHNTHPRTSTVTTGGMQYRNGEQQMALDKGQLLAGGTRRGIIRRWIMSCIHPMVKSPGAPAMTSRPWRNRKKKSLPSQKGCARPVLSTRVCSNLHTHAHALKHPWL